MPADQRYQEDLRQLVLPYTRHVPRIISYEITQEGHNTVVDGDGAPSSAEIGKKKVMYWMEVRDNSINLMSSGI